MSYNTRSERRLASVCVYKDIKYKGIKYKSCTLTSVTTNRMMVFSEQKKCFIE